MRRGALPLLATSLALLATSCGGSENPIRIGLVADCEGFVAPFYDVTLAGGELPLLRRGGKPAGSGPSQGVDGVEIGGRPLELVFGCASDGTRAAIETRRLVESERVDVLVGPNVVPSAAVIAEYARHRPEVTFVIATWDMLAHLNPGPNVFRFTPTLAQLNAGLGAHAFRELGWRRAVTIATADASSWGFQAGFVGEFCSLGGEIADRIWLDTFPEEVPAILAEVETDGVDGFFLATDSYAAGVFLERFAQLEPELAGRVIGGGSSLVLDPAVARRLGDRLIGIVKAGDLPLVSPTPELAAYIQEFEQAYPHLAETASIAEHAFDIPFYNAMEAVLLALEDVDGELSGEQERFRSALARIELDAPGGRVRLDDNRQAIVPVYLAQVSSSEDGRLSFRDLRTVEDVDASFGGRFEPGHAPPDRTEPPCEAGNPPGWAAGGG